MNMYVPMYMHACNYIILSIVIRCVITCMYVYTVHVLYVQEI